MVVHSHAWRRWRWWHSHRWPSGTIPEHSPHWRRRRHTWWHTRRHHPHARRHHPHTCHHHGWWGWHVRDATWRPCSSSTTNSVERHHRRRRRTPTAVYLSRGARKPSVRPLGDAAAGGILLCQQSLRGGAVPLSPRVLLEGVVHADRPVAKELTVHSFNGCFSSDHNRKNKTRNQSR